MRCSVPWLMAWTKSSHTGSVYPLPRHIVVTDSPEGLESMEVVDSEGLKQVVKLMKPLRYPRRVVER